MGSEGLVYDDGALALGHAGNVLITFWRGKGTLASVDAIAQLSSRVHARHPTGIVSLALARSNLAILTTDETVRARLKQLSKNDAGRTLAAATVILGDGMFVAGMRAVVVGLMLFNRMEQKVFASTDEAVRWLTPKMSAQAQTAGEVAAILAPLLA